MTIPTARKAVVVGAGPVGCLTALALAKRGWLVDLLEGRPGTGSLLPVLGIFRLC